MRKRSGGRGEKRHVIFAIFLLVSIFAPLVADADGREIRYTCRPHLPVFCRNIHVSCSGPTTVPTSKLEIWISGEKARLVFEGAEPDVFADVVRGQELVLRFNASQNWIRIEPGGRFSHRIYLQKGAAMSYGMCRHED